MKKQLENFMIKRNNIYNCTEFDDKVKWFSKRKYPCKRLKGEHDFELIETYDFKHLSKYLTQTYYSYRCKACGKKVIHILKQNTSRV